MAVSTTGYESGLSHDTRDQAEPWQSTRSQTSVATQIAADEQDYLTGDSNDRHIGRHVGGDQHEMFVSCDPAEALHQQLDRLRPDFIAMHDLGTTSTRKLLGSVASASRRSLQTLLIRRQGYGTTLATLQFLDLPTGDGKSLRLYTTETDADTTQRETLARVLLGYSRLGVLMVGDMPAHLLKSSLDALHDVMVTSAWTNRNLLLLPLTSSPLLAQESLALGRGTGVQVRTTPQVTRPADAWSFVSGTWNKLRGQAAPESPAPVAAVAVEPYPRQTPAYAPEAPPVIVSSPVPMTPMPVVGGAAPPTVESTLGRYVRMLGELTGMVSCCVFDIANARPLAHAGSRPDADDLATHGSAMLAGLGAASRNLGMGHALPEAAITLGAHHLLLRGVPKHPGVALHAVLDKTHANLTLARLQIVRMDSLFD